MTALEIDSTISPPELGERPMPVLETERLVLRAPRLEDAGTVALLLNDRSIAEMTATIPHPYCEKDANDWISNPASPKRNRFVVTRKSDGALIGATGYAMAPNGVPEVGYWLGVPFRGEGYATEGVRAVIDYLFTEHAIAAITANCRVINAQSRKVLERCGFQWEAAGLIRVAALGASVPVDKFRLDRALWQSLKAWRATTYRRQMDMVS